MLLLPRLGTELFPQTDPPQFQVRLRAPTGTRIERTELVALKALDVIRREIGPDNVAITTEFHRRAASELSDQHHLSLDQRPARGGADRGAQAGSSPRNRRHSESGCAQKLAQELCRMSRSRSKPATSSTR